MHTCYSPVRRSPAGGAGSSPAAARLACVKPAASGHPEPGSNSPLLVYIAIYLSCFVFCLDPVLSCWSESFRRGIFRFRSFSLVSLFLSCGNVFNVLFRFRARLSGEGRFSIADAKLGYFGPRVKGLFAICPSGGLFCAVSCCCSLFSKYVKIYFVLLIQGLEGFLRMGSEDK